jgi:hypothetical protein
MTPLITDLRWENAIPWVHIFALIGGETSAQQGATSAYKHSADFDDDVDGHFYSGHADIDSQAHELTSIKPVGFTFSVGPDGFMLVELRMMIMEVEHGINCANSGVTSVTMETNRLRIPFKNCKFRINSDAGALDDDDKVKISDLVISVDRDYERNDEAYGDAYSGAAFMTSEPKLVTQVPEILISIPNKDYDLTMEWDDDHRVAANDDAITYKADFTWEGAEADTGYNYTLTLSFPLIALTDIDVPIDHQNRINNPVTFRAMKPASAPNGMTGLTEYMRCELINTRTAIYAKA